MWRFFRSQHLRRMWIERYHHSCAACLPRVLRGRGNDRLVAEMNSVEDANRREKWAG